MLTVSKLGRLQDGELVVEPLMGGVCIRVVEGVERAVARHVDLEVLLGAAVVDLERERVLLGAPEQRDVDAVGGPVGQLPASVPCGSGGHSGPPSGSRWVPIDPWPTYEPPVELASANSPIRRRLPRIGDLQDPCQR